MKLWLELGRERGPQERDGHEMAATSVGVCFVVTRGSRVRQNQTHSQAGELFLKDSRQSGKVRELSICITAQ